MMHGHKNIKFQSCNVRQLANCITSKWSRIVDVPIFRSKKIDYDKEDWKGGRGKHCSYYREYDRKF